MLRGLTVGVSAAGLSLFVCKQDARKPAEGLQSALSLEVLPCVEVRPPLVEKLFLDFSDGLKDTDRLDRRTLVNVVPLDM